MKQRITIEDLQQLIDEQKQKLREWWKPAVGDVFYAENTENDTFINSTIKWLNNDKTGYLPLPSIGQMIELLIEKTTHFSIEYIYEDGKHIWKVKYGTYYTTSEELCDALLRAVKAVERNDDIYMASGQGNIMKQEPIQVKFTKSELAYKIINNHLVYPKRGLLGLINRWLRRRYE